MNTLSITLISIFIPIFSIIFIVASYFAIKWIYLKKYSKYFNDINDFLEGEPYIETITVLRTVDITLQEQEKTLIAEMSSASNDEIKMNDIRMEKISKDKEKFASQSINIEDKIEKMNQLKKTLETTLENSRVFSCKSIIKEIEKNKREIDEIKKNVTEQTKEFIDPINEFEEKRYKLTKIAHNIAAAAAKWKDEINSDVFWTNIKDSLNKMDEHLNEADKYVRKGNKEETYTSFTLFKKTLFDLVLFGNYYKKFKEVLFTKSSKIFEDVNDFIDKAKNKLNSNLSNLNIDIYLKNVEEELSTAKDSFYKLNVKETEKNIEKYYNSLQGLTNAVSQEINAYNFFLQYGTKEIHNIFSTIAFKYKEIEESCEKIFHIDRYFYWNVKNNLEEVVAIMNEIDSNINNFTQDENNEEILFSTKLSKYKKIFYLFHSFFNECDEIEKSIDNFYTEGISQGLKYNRIKKIYINGLSDIKKYGIKLTIEDNENISLIEKKKQEIETNIISQDNYSEKNLKQYVDQFFELVVKFIKMTLRKVIIVKSFSLITTEHGYKRLKNNLFNRKVVDCENMIQEGKYEEGLRNLIDSVKVVNN